MSSSLRKRATAVIINDNKILLIRRVKPGVEYFILPGGGVDENETIEEATIREVMEELNLKVKKYEFLFSLENIPVPQMITIHKGNRDEYIFKVIEYTGTPEIGGPEKERMSPENQYHLEWIDLSRLKEMKNIYPKVVIRALTKKF